MKKGTGKTKKGAGKAPACRPRAARQAPAVDRDEILPEYDFRGGRPNPYAARFAAGVRLVTLDPDVAEVFPSSAAVNDALRALAGVIRQHGPTKPRRRRTA